MPMSNAGIVESTGTRSLGARPRTILRSKPNLRRPLSPPKPENRLRGRGARMQQLRLRLSHTKTPTPPGVSPPRETRREGLRLVPPSPPHNGFLDGPLCMLCDHSTRIPPARGSHPREHRSHQGSLRHGKYHYPCKQYIQSQNIRGTCPFRSDCPAAKSLRGRRTPAQHDRDLFSPCRNSKY